MNDKDKMTHSIEVSERSLDRPCSDTLACCVQQKRRLKLVAHNFDLFSCWIAYVLNYQKFCVLYSVILAPDWLWLCSKSTLSASLSCYFYLCFMSNKR